MFTKKKAETSPPEVRDAEADIETESSGKRRHRVVNTIINIVLVAAMLLAAVCTYVSFVSTSGNGVPSILGVRLLSVQTESMYPTLNPGDLIFDKSVADKSELRVGDIITYWTVINGERTLNTHRITEIYDGGGYLIFATKGDNNSAEDSLTVHESEIVGSYWFRVPGVGKAVDYLQTSTGFLICIVIPVFIFFLYQLIQFFRTLFEYQNVKHRLQYELERGKNEEVIAEERRKADEERERKKKAMEDELRAQIKAELLASMKQANQADAPPAEPESKETETAPAEKAEEDKPAEDTPTEEPAESEAPEEEAKAEETSDKEAPAEEPSEAEAPAEETAEAEAAEEEKQSEPAETAAE